MTPRVREFAGHSVAKLVDGAWQTAAPGMFGFTSGNDGRLYARGFDDSAPDGTVIMIYRRDAAGWTPIAPNPRGAGKDPFYRPPPMAVDEAGDLCAGARDPNEVVCWNGTDWASVGPQFAGSVFALKFGPDGRLFVGGGFSRIGDLIVNHIAAWDGESWKALGSGLTRPDGDYANVRAVGFIDSDVYVAGVFSKAGSVDARHVARWDGDQWHDLDGGLNGGAWSLSVNGDGRLYVGGDFEWAGDANARYVAMWDGLRWRALGTGTNGVISTTAVASTGEVYVGGSFDSAGDAPSNFFGKWTPPDNADDSDGGSHDRDRVHQVTIWPNPFRTSFEVEVKVPTAGPFEIGLFDVLGRLLSTRHIDAAEPTRRYTVQYDDLNLAAGVYILEVAGGGFTASETVVGLGASR